MADRWFCRLGLDRTVSDRSTSPRRGMTASGTAISSSCSTASAPLH
nr:hypothetical protein [Bradyrhizobium valentinum]